MCLHVYMSAKTVIWVSLKRIFSIFTGNPPFFTGNEDAVVPHSFRPMSRRAVSSKNLQMNPHTP
jgi:hypothetical protein